MSTNAIVTISNLDINKVTFGDVRPNKAGGKSVPVKYGGQNLQIRIPKTTYPMGVKVKESQNGTSYTMALTLKGCDPFAKERATSEAGEFGNFYNFLLDVQDKLFKTAQANSVKWWGKSRSEEGLLESMKQVLNPSVEKVNGAWVPSGKYPPSLFMKVPVYNGEVSMDVVDASGKHVEVDLSNITQHFPKRVEASIVVSPNVYISGNGFGITWRISFVRISPPQHMSAADVFADELSEETTGASGFESVEEMNNYYGLTQDAPAPQQQEEVTRPVTPPSQETPQAPPPAPKSNRRRQAAV
jgi:hypothetical protein